jgi:hypothetical protein
LLAAAFVYDLDIVYLTPPLPPSLKNEEIREERLKRIPNMI